MSEQNPKLVAADYRGPNEPSYKPVGLTWQYWSDLGAEEGLRFLRTREPHLDEVTDWLVSQGFHPLSQVSNEDLVEELERRVASGANPIT